jgi:hypothetical protein
MVPTASTISTKREEGPVRTDLASPTGAPILEGSVNPPHGHAGLTVSPLAMRGCSRSPRSCGLVGPSMSVKKRVTVPVASAIPKVSHDRRPRRSESRGIRPENPRRRLGGIDEIVCGPSRPRPRKRRGTAHGGRSRPGRGWTDTPARGFGNAPVPLSKEQSESARERPGTMRPIDRCEKSARPTTRRTAASNEQQ